MNHRLIHGDCLEILGLPRADCIFADPPDNIGLKYPGVDDNLPDDQYIDWLWEFIEIAVNKAPIFWLSFNAKWIFNIGAIVEDLQAVYSCIKARLCVQTFTFGQHRQTDFGNNFRPLLRLAHEDATFYPNQIRIPSWRQLNGDERADPRGRVPGDVFEFPRVTGNSHQRRAWCPTQLHEGLVERVINFSTLSGGTVIDPFAGTGTTLRVCKRIGRQCTLIEKSKAYCSEIAKEHNLKIEQL